MAFHFCDKNDYGEGDWSDEEFAYETRSPDYVVKILDNDDRDADQP